VTATMLVSAPASADSGYDLFSACQGTTPSPVWSQGFCLGYVAAAFAAMGGAGTICGPASVQRGQLQMIFENWARRHPELLREAQGDAVALALMEAFPCKEPKPAPRVSRIPAWPNKPPDQLVPR